MVNSLLAENKQLEVGFQRSPACVVADIKRSSCLGTGNWKCQLGYLMGLHSDTYVYIYIHMWIYQPLSTGDSLGFEWPREIFKGVLRFLFHLGRFQRLWAHQHLFEQSWNGYFKSLTVQQRFPTIGFWESRYQSLDMTWLYSLLHYVGMSRKFVKQICLNVIAHHCLLIIYITPSLNQTPKKSGSHNNT